MAIQEISYIRTPQPTSKISSLTYLHFQFNLALAAQKKGAGHNAISAKHIDRNGTAYYSTIITAEPMLFNYRSIDRAILPGGHIILWLSGCRISFLEISEWIYSQSLLHSYFDLQYLQDYLWWMKYPNRADAITWTMTIHSTQVLHYALWITAVGQQILRHPRGL